MHLSVSKNLTSEKAMAPHSSTLAWKIPWTEEPGVLQSMGSLRVRHDFTFMHWRRKWQPTPVFLLGESQGWGSLVGCCLLGRTESDTTEATQQQQQHISYIVIYTLCNLKHQSQPPQTKLNRVTQQLSNIFLTIINIFHIVMFLCLIVLI